MQIKHFMSVCQLQREQKRISELIHSELSKDAHDEDSATELAELRLEHVHMVKPLEKKWNGITFSICPTCNTAQAVLDDNNTDPILSEQSPQDEEFKDEDTVGKLDRNRWNPLSKPYKSPKGRRGSLMGLQKAKIVKKIRKTYEDSPTNNDGFKKGNDSQRIDMLSYV
eukprot:771530_1